LPGAILPGIFDKFTDGPIYGFIVRDSAVAILRGLFAKEQLGLSCNQQWIRYLMMAAELISLRFALQIYTATPLTRKCYAASQTRLTNNVCGLNPRLVQYAPGSDLLGTPYNR